MYKNIYLPISITKTALGNAIQTANCFWVSLKEGLSAGSELLAYALNVGGVQHDRT